MKLFFDKEINDLGVFSVVSQEAIHISKVLRLKTGQEINFTNGKGFLFTGTIVELNKKNILVNFTKKTDKKLKQNHKLHIAIAPTKNIDRFEWFIEKAVETGISRITPIISKYSERKVIKKERLEKVIISAMKQSLKFEMPQLDELINFTDFIKNEKAENKFISYCKANNKITEINPQNNNLFIVGPEGGFSDEEIEKAISYNYKLLKISNYRLRTETAGVVISSVFNAIF